MSLLHLRLDSVQVNGLMVKWIVRPSLTVHTCSSRPWWLGRLCHSLLLTVTLLTLYTRSIPSGWGIYSWKRLPDFLFIKTCHHYFVLVSISYYALCIRRKLQTENKNKKCSSCCHRKLRPLTLHHPQLTWRQPLPAFWLVQGWVTDQSHDVPMKGITIDNRIDQWTSKQPSKYYHNKRLLSYYVQSSVFSIFPLV